jgi:hypothetical protein
MAIFYPREISTSLEEKNRQLMNLINRTNENTDMDNENNENNMMHNENSMLNATADGEYTMSESTTMMNNESRLLSDFSNNNDMLLNGGVGSMRGKHAGRGRGGKHGQSGKMDNYLQEPQFVTKRTSSGRLVKMKISTDYDYDASDQEKETRKKKSKNFRARFFKLISKMSSLTSVCSDGRVVKASD